MAAMPMPPQGAEQQPAADASETPGNIDDAQSENASPAEQEQYNQIVEAAQSMIYSEAGKQVIVQKLKTSGNPAQDIGHTAGMIGLSLKAGIEQQGGEIPDEVMLHAGGEIVADLCDIAKAAGIVQTVDEDLFKKAMFYAAQEFGNGVVHGGGFNPKARAQAQLDIANLRKQHGIVAKGKPPGAAPAGPPGAAPANIAQAQE